MNQQYALRRLDRIRARLTCPKCGHVFGDVVPPKEPTEETAKRLEDSLRSFLAEKRKVDVVEAQMTRPAERTVEQWRLLAEDEGVDDDVTVDFIRWVQDQLGREA